MNVNQTTSFVVIVDDIEKRLAIKGLLELKERLKSEDRNFSFVDDLIVKFIDAKEVKERRSRYAEKSSR